MRIHSAKRARQRSGKSGLVFIIAITLHNMPEVWRSASGRLRELNDAHLDVGITCKTSRRGLPFNLFDEKGPATFAGIPESERVEIRWRPGHGAVTTMQVIPSYAMGLLLG
jgi:hypothetical protein